MADITMCTQTLCPNSEHCYRIHAPLNNQQSWQAFDYKIGIDGVICAGYLPMYQAVVSDRTAESRPT